MRPALLGTEGASCAHGPAAAITVVRDISHSAAVSFTLVPSSLMASVGMQPRSDWYQRAQQHQ
jgi:hypothetical protein